MDASSYGPLAPAVASGRPPVFACSRTDRDREASWVHLRGELDIATAPLLNETLYASRPDELRARVVVLDMRDLEFVDASGVHAITEADIRARGAGGRLVLVRGPPAVDRVFTLTRSYEHLKVVDLEPAEPAVVALLHLAQAERAA